MELHKLLGMNYDNKLLVGLGNCSKQSACAALGCWHKRRWPLFWSERRCADGFVESAVGHYFAYFSFSSFLLLLVAAVAKPQ